MDLLLFRLYTSLTTGGVGELYWLLSSAPNTKFLDQVYVTKKSKPCENRFVTLACRASYQVFPMGLKYWTKVVYSGNCRRACATVNWLGNPLKGRPPKPRAAASGELI